MLNLNPFAISGLLITATYLPLCLFLIVYGRTKLARIFLLQTLSVLIWGIGSFLIGINTDPSLAAPLLRFSYVGVLAIPVFLFHTSYIITKNHRRWLLISIYALFLYFLDLNLFGKMMDSNRFFFNSFYFVSATTPYTLSFIFWLCTVFLALLPLIPYYKKSFHKERQQGIVLLLGGIGCAGGLTNFFMAFGLNIFPYGNFAVPLHSILCSYAILKHQMLGINVAINRGMVYSILIFILSSLYLILVLVLEKILQAFFAYNSAGISIVAAFVIGLICFPLRAKIQAMVDQLVFHKSPEEIANENERLWDEIVKSERLNASAILASGVAHEVKNPLTAIRTFTEYLPKKKDDPEFLEKFARIVGQEVGRIDDLVHQLLDFAKPDPLAVKPTDINALVSDLLVMLSQKCVQHHIRVDFRPAATPLMTLPVDPAKIHQALLNILLNAIDAMPEGGELKVRTDIISSENGPAIGIKITDTGPGIPPEDQARIFDPFFSKKDNGTGLGLSITQGIIREHAGQITLQSTPIDGTTFIIVLPLAQE